MNLKGNHVCFVAARISPKKVKVSARSDGSVNVQLLMEKLGGGGGHFASAAGVFENSTIDEVKEAATMYNHKVVSIKYVGKDTVYNGTVEKYHNYFRFNVTIVYWLDIILAFRAIN